MSKQIEGMNQEIKALADSEGRYYPDSDCGGFRSFQKS